MAKLKKSWTTDCPCCGNLLAIDPETHEVVAHAARLSSGTGGAKGGSNEPVDQNEKPDSSTDDGNGTAEGTQDNPWNW